MKKYLYLTYLFLLTSPLVGLAQIQYTPLAPLPNTPSNVIIDNGGSFFSSYLNNLYMLGVALCTALAVLMIVVGGVQWASSDAWSKKAEGKERIWAAVLGLLIALGSWVIVNTISPEMLNTDLKTSEVVNVSSIPLGERTAEEKRFAETTPTTIPQSDPSYTPQFNEDGTLKVRSTYYYAGEPGSDEDTNNGRSSTGTPLRTATNTQVGVAAVDPNIIPYGSLITVQTSDGPRYYVAADTGGAVKNQTASNGSAPVIDFYSNKQVSGDYTNVSIQYYRGDTPYTNLSASQKESFFRMSNYTQ